MRTLRIFSLLFSLFQFILVLKLIEIVRGDPIPNKLEQGLSPLSESNIDNDRESRHFFVAPNVQKKRKFKPWLTSSETPSTDYPYDGNDGVDDSPKFDRIGVIDGNSTEANNSTSESTSDETARLCPGCVGQCGGNLTPYGFPALEVFISLVVGVIWFFIFLYFWYYIIKPKPISTARNFDSSPGSLWDFVKGRGFGSGSLDNFNQLTSLVIDSLSKLTNLYSNL